jgi:glycosyl transferase family 2
VRIVQTLVVRDEADIVDDQLAYHLNAGVDFVIASDHQSTDGTTEILERYARAGVLHRIAVTGKMRDAPWRTPHGTPCRGRVRGRLGRQHGRGRVLDASRWHAQGLLASVPETHGVVFALSRHFVPRPDDGSHFSERMVVRASPRAAIHDPTSPYRPHLKAAHRADSTITISFGSHTVSSGRWRPLQHWHPADVLHFPFRSPEPWENKGSRAPAATSRSVGT